MMIPLRTAYRRRLAIGALIVAAAAVLPAAPTAAPTPDLPATQVLTASSQSRSH